MRSKLLALAVLLAGGAVCGQPGPSPRQPEGAGSEKAKPAVKSALEEALAQALKDNPDLKVAAAKLNEAEAQLSRTRLQVVQKVVMQHRAIEQAKAALVLASAQYERVKRLHQVRGASREELDQAEQQFGQAKAKLADTEAEMAFLRGKSAAKSSTSKQYREAYDNYLRALVGTTYFAPAVGYYRQYGPYPVPHAVKGPVADKWRKALNRRISLKFTDTTAEEMIRSLRKDNPDVPIRVIGKFGSLDMETVDLKDVPFGAALQFIEDVLPSHRIVVREYGLLIAPKDRVPPGAVLLHEFWKGSVEPTPAADKGRPPASLKGKVKAVEKSGLVSLDVGSDAGLAKGHTLDVFRLTPAPRYLGTISIVGVSPHQAVGRATGRLAGNIQVGDQVAARIEGR
jgi:hypothetical protein